MPASHQDTAARRYRIEKYLTEGGMGAIYIGKKLGPGGFAKEVVLKQLLPEYTARPEFRDLFFREAKISATLDHANIVHTFDLVESDQSLFIVMEYVRGADLRTIIRRARQRRRELSPAAAIHVALEILAGLGYAHTRRDASGKSLDIIHRDVSPSNIICSIEGAAKLSDFGIAKASTYSSVFYRVRGKVGYMSPEQARSQTIDHRCDLFSLSVCLYESLSGERLFVGDLNTPADEIYGVPILPVSQKRAGLPPALDDVLARALAPNVDDRYQSAAELGEALRTVAHRNGLAFSAPELAAHLRDILGDDPERWLREEPQTAATEPQSASAPAPNSDLVGTEASSIGIVDDIPEDTPGRGVLSPSAVSGSKDFDLDSMLDDESTRPGGPAPRQLPPDQAGRVEDPSTPPPVWTRDSAPFPLATPKPAAVTPRPVRRAPTPKPVRRMPTPRPQQTQPQAPRARLAAPTVLGVGAAPPPPASPPSRPLPRPAPRVPPAPPPFAPAVRAPAAPPFPAGSAARGGHPGDGIEDATPPPPQMGETPPPVSPRGFDIEDALTPAPMTATGRARPTMAGLGPPPLRPSYPSGPPPGQSLFSSPSLPAPFPYAAPSMEPPLVLNQPQTIDFRGAVTAMLPEKKSGPPGWIAAILVMMSMVGGAVLAHRFVGAEAAALAAPPPAVRSAAQPGREDDQDSPAPRESDGVPAPRPRPADELDAQAEPLDDGPPPAAAGGASKPATATKSKVASNKAAKRGTGKAAKRTAAKTAQKRRGKH